MALVPRQQRHAVRYREAQNRVRDLVQRAGYVYGHLPRALQSYLARQVVTYGDSIRSYTTRQITNWMNDWVSDNPNDRTNSRVLRQRVDYPDEVKAYDPPYPDTRAATPFSMPPGPDSFGNMGGDFNTLYGLPYKRRYNKRRYRPTLKRLQKQVNKLFDRTKIPWVMTRTISYGNIKCETNEVNYSEFLTATSYEAGQLFSNNPFRYVDPTNGTTGTVDWSTIMNSNSTIPGHIDLMIKNWRVSVTFRNNYNDPIKVEVFFISRRLNESEVNSTPLAQFDLGLVQAGASTTTAIARTDPNWTLYNSPLFVDNWKITSHKKFYMKPGDELFRSLKTPFYAFNTKDFVVGSSSQLISPKLHAMIVRVQGIIIHDTTDQTKVGTAEAGLDFTMYTSAELGARLDSSQMETVSKAGGFATILPANAEFANPTAAPTQTVPDNDS